MIFRRRRTRIEIEQTSVKLQGGVLYPFVAPPAPAPVEATLACVLPFPAPEPNQPVVEKNDFLVTVSPETSTSSTARQETRP